MNVTKEQLKGVIEKIFHEFGENLSSQARHCRCCDAAIALYEVESAINMMDIPYTLKQMLDEEPQLPDIQDHCGELDDPNF